MNSVLYINLDSGFPLAFAPPATLLGGACDHGDERPLVRNKGHLALPAIAHTVGNRRMSYEKERVVNLSKIAKK